ncbi:L-idonate 5-dehydrogenase [Pseudoponticoccus marisrubri]|uniref:L-idonate 5-dehydrogenase n=1 Tax=Pseudoponticoccus marisrubri TaxID=1685382 RepID=A0A0W7WDN5_9RHOB|nr:L-idonate 5-dehydrogenase [Pseudoponticoccus marisrubri]KUF08669.1 L-idonate 5-dehydrogenase [Pseudoponticoccus marisrubri]
MDTRVCRLYAEGDIRIETETVADPGPGEVLVAVAAGGICGSDLHYYRHGGFGPIRVREPIILGHEAAGRVVATGPDVTTLNPGMAVAINPSRPCGTCRYCAEGMPTHCLDMQFRGSAMRMPHVQGLFRERIVVEAGQCVPVPDGVDIGAAACSEPLAVCLHARNMAGPLAGKRVLITGAGPIGVLCAAVARDAGAEEIVVTDLQDAALDTARAMGATRTLNVARDGDAMAAYGAEKGHFHVAFECSAAAPAQHAAIAALRPQGALVQLGIAGDLPLPVNVVVGKEIRVQGSFRFHAEFAEAVSAIAEGRIDVRPMISARFPLERAREAFEMAGDRSRAVKVHLGFESAL